MHWWQGAFTSSSKPPADNDAVIGRGDGEAGGTRNFIKTGLFSSRRNRNLQRARKLPDVAENDVELWRSPSHSSVGSFSSSPSTSASAAPQPLPMPELHLLLQRDPKFSKSSSGTVPLPSPQTRIQNPRRGLVEKLRGRGGDGDTIDELNADAIDGLNGLKSGFEGQDKKIHAERYGIRPSKKSPLKKNAKERSINSCSISIPNSAPTSPYSSPILSPRRSDTSQYMIPPDVLQVWSAPEMPHTDRHVGLGFYQVHARKSVSSVDSSPLQSPRLSNHARDTSPVMSVLPLNVKVSSETPLARREKETCAPSTVHPLPLPPLASALQPLPVSPLTSRSDISGTSTAKLEYSGSNIPIPHSPISPAPEIVPVKSQWQKGKLIGRGTFGSVYVASNRETGALCAMKEVEILPDDSKSAESLKQLQQEINVLSHLKHPNIVQYYGSEIVDDKFYIYLEYVHPGSINKFIHDHCGVMTESVVRNFTRHILSGLAYLHSKKTIHRDIKGANLLVDAYGVVKLADFGMAKHLNGQAANLSLKGSPYWLAPELLQSSVQTEASSDIALAVDIWSLGCTIIEMLNGKPPWSEYEGAAALFKVLQESPPIPETLSADGKDFLHRCFCRNPAERPTAAMLLEHPFVNNMHQHQHQHSDSCIHSLKEIRLSDHTQLIRGRSAHKYDQIPTMFDLQKKAKLGNNENIQRSHYQPNAPLAVVPFPSPRSTLDGLNAFSSPSLGHSPDSPSARIIFIYIKIIYTHTHKNKKESTVLRESWKHREWSLHRFNPLTNPAPTTLHNCKKTSKIKWLMTVALASMTVRTAASTTCSVTSVNFEFLLVYIIISILLGYTYVFLGLNTFASSCYFLFK